MSGVVLHEYNCDRLKCVLLMLTQLLKTIIWLINQLTLNKVINNTQCRLVKKQDPRVHYLKETQFKQKNANRLSIQGWKRRYHTNTEQNVAALISDNVDFRSKKIIRSKESLPNNKGIN